MTPFPRTLFGLTVLTLALPLAARAQNPCERRMDWGPPGPPNRPSCVGALKGLESGPTEEEFKAAARCVREESRERAARIAELAEKNGCVAETLMQFEELLDTTEDVDGVLRQAYDHYIINTPGPFGENEGLDPLERAQVYGRRLLQV